MAISFAAMRYGKRRLAKRVAISGPAMVARFAKIMFAYLIVPTNVRSRTTNNAMAMVTRPAATMIPIPAWNGLE